MDEKKKIKIVSYDLDVITTHVQKIMNRRNCTDVLFNLRVNDALNELEMIFWKEYIGKHQMEVIEFYIPKSWKDFFKNTHKDKKWMSWWIKRHPVQKKKLSFKLSKIHIFPEVKVPRTRDFKTKMIYLEANIDEE